MCHAVKAGNNKLAKLRVHIAPVGFEIDRIVLPATEMKADRVWLIRHYRPREENAAKFIGSTKKRLEDAKMEVLVKDADRTSLFKMLGAVREIFEKEGGENNELYVNASSGSKIQAIACMMACMTFNEFGATPYYAVPKEYRPKDSDEVSTGLRSIQDLPKYIMRRPSDDLVKALKIVISSEDGKITKKKLAELAEKEGIIKAGGKDENLSQSRFASLETNVIRPLEEWKFIRVSRVGRNRVVEATKEGSDAAEFLVGGDLVGPVA